MPLRIARIWTMDVSWDKRRWFDIATLRSGHEISIVEVESVEWFAQRGYRKTGQSALSREWITTVWTWAATEVMLQPGVQWIREGWLGLDWSRESGTIFVKHCDSYTWYQYEKTLKFKTIHFASSHWEVWPHPNWTIADGQVGQAGEGKDHAS